MVFNPLPFNLYCSAHTRDPPPHFSTGRLVGSCLYKTVFMTCLHGAKSTRPRMFLRLDVLQGCDKTSKMTCIMRMLTIDEAYQFTLRSEDKLQWLATQRFRLFFVQKPTSPPTRSQGTKSKAPIPPVRMVGQKTHGVS